MKKKILEPSHGVLQLIKNNFYSVAEATLFNVSSSGKFVLILLTICTKVIHWKHINIGNLHIPVRLCS